MLKGLGSNKNGAVMQQVWVSTTAGRRTDTGKDVDQSSRSGGEGTDSTPGAVICFLSLATLWSWRGGTRQKGRTAGI